MAEEKPSLVLLQDWEGHKAGSVLALLSAEEEKFLIENNLVRPANTREAFLSLNPEKEGETDAKAFSYFGYPCSCGNIYFQKHKGCGKCGKDALWKSLIKMPKPPVQFRKDLQEILENPVQRFMLEIDKLFKGEIKAALAIFLICSTRLVINATSTSSNLLVNSSSGAGKDYIISKILEAFDPNFAIARSRISPTALNYWHDSRKDPLWTWNGKVLYLADISNAVLNSEIVKCFLSGQNIASITDRGKVIELEVHGKPALILTAAFPSQNQEQLRRLPILLLDESEQQTKAILGFQAKKASGQQTDSNFSFEFREAMHYLERVEVEIPFSNELAEFFPIHLNARTAFPRLLDFVKAVAAIHQYARKHKQVNEKDTVIANIEIDYALAREVFLATTSNENLTTLTKRQQEIMAFFTENQEQEFPVSTLLAKEQLQAIPERTLWRDLDKLVEFGFLSVNKQKIEEVIRPVKHYRFKKFSKINLPTREQLLEKTQQRASVPKTENDMAQ